MSCHHHHYGHQHFEGDCGHGASLHHYPHCHSYSCSGYGPRAGYHHSHGLSCSCGELKVKRRYRSPEELKEKLVKYVDELKKELAGAEAELEKLGR